MEKFLSPPFLGALSELHSVTNAWQLLGIQNVMPEI